MFTGIKNKHELAKTPLRAKALEIVEAGFRAIDTEAAILQNFEIDDHELRVKDEVFSLEEVSRIHVIGFGKAACEGAAALEEVLGPALDSGIVIDIDTKTCNLIETFQADHPKPSNTNVEASSHIVELARSLEEDDLVIIAVSGGGSALLCYPASECDQSQRLYDEFLEAGGTIQELNTVRKHLSQLKGGGLAKELYPAQVVGLIFSDVPGGRLSDVASGPTFYDDSTIEDAKGIIEKYDISDGFEYFETPKDRTYFEKVTNIPLVTSEDAFAAMAKQARSVGLDPQVLSTKMYDFAAPTIERFVSETPPGTVSFGGGEIRLVVDKESGKGGRNLYLANEALQHIKTDNRLFISVASDGLDNTDAAGAIADKQVLEKMTERKLDAASFLKNYNSYELFEQTGDLIFTGATGANVADIMLYIHDE